MGRSLLNQRGYSSLRPRLWIIQMSKRMHNPFGHHHPEPQQPYQAPHGSQYPQPIQGEIVKIYCEANLDFFLAGRNGSVVMAPENESDPSQQWIMDTSWSVKAKDDEGFPAFPLSYRPGIEAWTCREG